MIIKRNLLFFGYILITFFLLFEILFSEKNIFVFLNNLKIVKQNQKILEQKNQRLKNLNKFLENFKNNPEFRKIVIKDKLFYKKEDEKIIRYEIIAQ